MDKEQKSSFNPGMVLIVFGVVTYMVVDSGLIKGISFSFLNPQQTSPQSRDESLQVYASKIQQELGAVESAVGEQKLHLRNLQKEIANYEKNIVLQKRNLKELDENIKNLTQLKNNSSPVAITTGKRSRAPASLASIAQSVGRDSDHPTTIEAFTLEASNFMRLKTKLRFDTEQTIYLTSRGIRQVRLFVEGMKFLGYDSITLAYQKDSDSETVERLQVLRSHLQDQYGEQVTVSTRMLSDEDVGLTDGLELWASKAGS
jgi:hypothetical protein